MGYTNSPLVAYTKISPNHSGQRTHRIDRISPHCVVGQCSAEGLGDWFYRTSTQASSNYGIDKNGRVGMYVEEKNRSWCTSSNANDQRAITIARISVREMVRRSCFGSGIRIRALATSQRMMKCSLQCTDGLPIRVVQATGFMQGLVIWQKRLQLSLVVPMK